MAERRSMQKNRNGMQSVVPASRPAAHGLPPAGFTLVELLAVITIIVILMAIALPALSKVYKSAIKTRMAADLQVISAGLEAYKGDFKDYPRDMPQGLALATHDANNAPVAPPPTAANQGAILLCWVLVAPGVETNPQPTTDLKDQNADGADGPGFRVRAFADPNNPGSTIGQGQVYGPYVATGRFRIGPDPMVDLINSPPQFASGILPCILDRNGHAYLYFPGNRNASASTNYVAQWTPPSAPGNLQPMFNANDNLTMFRHGTEPGDTVSLQRIQTVMGDTGTPGAGGSVPPPNGRIDAGETAAYTGPYLLWGAGPDEQYGPGYIPGTTQFDMVHFDDVTNFR